MEIFSNKEVHLVVHGIALALGVAIELGFMKEDDEFARHVLEDEMIEEITLFKIANFKSSDFDEESLMKFISSYIKLNFMRDEYSEDELLEMTLEHDMMIIDIYDYEEELTLCETVVELAALHEVARDRDDIVMMLAVLKFATMVLDDDQMEYFTYLVTGEEI